MTDRELLELAAKAAGYDFRYDYDETFLRCIIVDGFPESWNPLEDDGDALRLAVKLNLWEAIRLAHRLVGLPECLDFYAATRRAIVRAAAEIGKAMP